MNDKSSANMRLTVEKRDGIDVLIRSDIPNWARPASPDEVWLSKEIERLQQRVDAARKILEPLHECDPDIREWLGMPRWDEGVIETRAAEPPNLGLISDRAPAMVKELLESYFWLPSLRPNTRYSRLQDDHDGEQVGWLSVTFGEDGDAWVGLDDDARFRMPGHGGGRSQYTRTALHILAEAIRTDNARDRAAETKTAVWTDEMVEENERAAEELGKGIIAGKVTDETKLAAPWRCTICRNMNPDDAIHCRQCGYSRTVMRDGKSVPRDGKL